MFPERSLDGITFESLQALDRGDLSAVPCYVPDKAGAQHEVECLFP